MMARIITFSGNTALNFSATLGLSSFSRFQDERKEVGGGFPLYFRAVRRLRNNTRH